MNNVRVISLLSDFGLKDGYVAQMKGVIAGLCDARIIDITHMVSPHTILEGAFILRSAVSYFPRGSVHVAVVDPGVGTDRCGIVVTARDHVFVGPDNGLLIPAARLLGEFTVYKITNKNVMLRSVSHTFDGRDVFAPVAAHIVLGMPFERIGEQTNSYVELDSGQAVFSGKSVSGRVLYIDHFGNIITNIDGAELLEHVGFGSQVMVFVGDKRVELPFVRSYGLVDTQMVLGTIGGSTLFEIGANQGDAAKKFKVKPGASVKVLFS